MMKNTISSIQSEFIYEVNYCFSIDEGKYELVQIQDAAINDPLS